MVGDSATVVGRQFGDFGWASAFDLAEEIDAAAIGLVIINFHEDAACGAVNDHEQVAPR